MHGCCVALIGIAVAGCSVVQPSLSPSPPLQPQVSGPASDAAPSRPPQAWSARAAAPLALTEVAVAAHRGAIWVAGGLDGSATAVDRVLVYDPAADAWSDGPRLPEPVHHASLASDGSALYLLGGYTGSSFDRPTDAVSMLPRPEDQWLDHSRLPEPRAAGGSAWDGRRLVYAGGVGPAGATATVFVHDGESWALAGRLSEAREHLAAASDGAGSTFVLGGRRGGLAGNRSAVDLVGGDAVGRLGEVPTARGGVAAFWWPAVGACLAGGESPGGTNDQVECIDPDGRVTTVASLMVPRHGLGAAVVDGIAYVVLGGPEPGLVVSDVVEALVLDE